MRAILLSIRPEWCVKILNGEKTVEIRKTKPKLEAPFKCYIYCTQPKDAQHRLWRAATYYYCDERSHNGPDRLRNGKVIAELTCDRIGRVAFEYYDRIVDVVDCDTSCLSPKQILDYAGGQVPLYGWHISDLKIYDRPNELSDFTGIKSVPRELDIPFLIKRPPQSWCYVEELEDDNFAEHT